MSRHSESENRNYNDTQRESAEYTADLLLGLRKTARRNDLSFLAHLLEMAGDSEAAITHYRIAAGRTTSIPERNYLIAQAARLAMDSR